MSVATSSPQLEARRDAGELFILVVGEADAPDAAALGRAADLFLGQLAEIEADEKPEEEVGGDEEAAADATGEEEARREEARCEEEVARPRR